MGQVGIRRSVPALPAMPRVPSAPSMRQKKKDNPKKHVYSSGAAGCGKKGKPEDEDKVGA